MKLLSMAMVISVIGTGVLAGDISFPIQNNGTSNLTSFKYSESGTNAWTDVFASDKLDSGQSIEVVLSDRDSCLFDIKAEFSDGSSVNETSVNLCELSGGYSFD